MAHRQFGTFRFGFMLLLAVCSAACVLHPLYAESAAPGTTQASPSALSEVRKTLDDVVQVIEEFPGDNNKKVRREKMREIIQPRFDFDEMAKRSLGPNWQTATPEQRDEFVKVFSDLLASTYLNKIETVKKNMVSIDSENVEFPKSVVKTTVKHKGDTFPIDYKLLNTRGSWRVYDVVIENIGLVANYRNEFAGIIRKEKFTGLLERLREKVKPLEAS